MARNLRNQGTASLSDTVERKLLEYVEEFVKEESQKSIFAIGGRIPVIKEGEQIQRSPEPIATAAAAGHDWIETCTIQGPEVIEPVQTLNSPPITIRWDIEEDPESETDNGSVLRVDLPAIRAGDDGRLERLINSCNPATFGRGMKDVYDESYRKATKLDPSRFSTNFNPYEFGIVNSITKVLLPSVLAGSSRKTACSREVRAELYKLNIYSAPSGKFKAHVDTPRAVSQFGSLVVCLPSSHEGGQLVVRHHGEEVVFDWASPAESTSSPQQQDPDHSVQWAAFYSDCEHEVLEVTKGHRVTLTYNLYSVSHGIPSGISAMDPETLPVAKLFQNMLTNPGFLSKGAILGFHCAHAYAHTMESLLVNQTLPSSLKGVDMAIYTALRAAGLEVCLRPALPESDWKDDLHWQENPDWGNEAFEKWIDDLKLCDQYWDPVWDSMFDWVSVEGVILRDPSEKVEIEVKCSNGEYEYRLETDEDLGPKVRTKLISLWQQFRGMKKTTVIGKKLLPYKSSERTIGYDDETIFDVMDDWAPSRSPWDKTDQTDDGKASDTEAASMFKDYCHLTPELKYVYKVGNAEMTHYDLVQVHWVNEPVHKEPAIGYMTYGNEAGTAMLYSRLAIFARVPPLEERLG